MAINSDSPLGIELKSAVALNDKDFGGYLKKAAIFASFAAAILASGYVAQVHTSHWWKITATVSLISLYALPKILHYCNANMIKNSLTFNLATLSSLFLGGIASATFSMSRTMVVSFKTYQISTALFCACGTTALLGYGVPLFRDAMVKAYLFLTQSDVWKDNFSNLQKQFHRMPEMGLGLLQTNLWQNFILQLSLLKPEIVLSFWRILFIGSPDYVWSMAAASTEKVTIDQFEELLDSFIQASTSVAVVNEDLPDEIKENYHNRLKIALKGLRKEDFRAAVELLLTSGSKFVPHILSNDQFLELFTDDALEATNQAIEQLLDQSDRWSDLVKRHQALEDDIASIERNISQAEQDAQDLQQESEEEVQKERSEEQTSLSDQLTRIKEEFSSLRREVEKVYADKRIWQDFTHLWSQAHDLPFEKGDRLLSYLQDHTTMDEIDKTYRSFSVLNCRIQLATNKLLVSNDELDEEEPLSITDILAHKQGFIAHDFEMMQEWLDLDSPHDLADVLASIGLETEEDLYRHEILQRQNPKPKTDVLENLRIFIEKSEKKKKPAARADALDATDQRQKVIKLKEKVARALYHMTFSGMILVPILIEPYAGFAGFVLGSAVFTLGRFGVRGAKGLIHASNAVIKSIPCGTFIRDLIGRRVFSITPRRRESANLFLSANFFGKMRLINLQMVAAFFTSSISIRIRQPSIGSFLQGVALSNEVVHLF